MLVELSGAENVTVRFAVGLARIAPLAGVDEIIVVVGVLSLLPPHDAINNNSDRAHEGKRVRIKLFFLRTTFICLIFFE